MGPEQMPERFSAEDSLSPGLRRSQIREEDILEFSFNW